MASEFACPRRWDRTLGLPRIADPVGVLDSILHRAHKLQQRTTSVVNPQVIVKFLLFLPLAAEGAT